MKVLLKQDVDTLGFAGEIFEVSAGYGRNFLIPQGLALPATESTLKQSRVWIAQATARREQIRKEYAAMVERLDNTNLTFTRKAGETGKLYGSVTTTEIADTLEEQVGIEVDRRKIDGKPLRQLGVHNVSIRFDGEFVANIKVNIVPEEDDEDTPVAEVVTEADAVKADEPAVAEADEYDDYDEYEEA